MCATFVVTFVVFAGGVEKGRSVKGHTRQAERYFQGGVNDKTQRDFVFTYFFSDASFLAPRRATIKGATMYYKRSD